MENNNNLSKINPLTTFKLERKIDSIYTGGKVFVCPKNKFIVTSSGPSLYITDILTSEKKLSIHTDEESQITSFALNDDTIVISSTSLLLSSYDMESGELLKSWKAHDAPILMMQFDPTGTLLATGSADSTIKVWDVKSGSCTHNFKGHRGVISALKFHPDYTKWILFSGGDDCQVRSWDLRTKKCVDIMESHSSVIRGLDVSPCHKYLVSGSRDKTICVWNLNKSSKITNVEKMYPVYESLENVGFIEFRNRVCLFSGGENGIIKLWDFETGNTVFSQVKQSHHKYQLLDVFYAKSDYFNQLIAVTSDHNILFYDVENGMRRVKQIIGYNDEIVDIAFIGPEQENLAVVTNSEQLRLFNVNNYNCEIIYGHVENILCMSVKKQFLATGSKDKTARVLKLSENGKYEFYGECVGHAEGIVSLSLSVKHSCLLTASNDLTVKKWDLQNPEQFLGYSRFSSAYTIKAHEKDINCLSLNSNEKLFATSSQDRTIKIWNFKDGEPLATLIGHRRGVWSVQFSPTENILASGSGDKTIKLWSLSDYSCIATFEGHTNSVLKVSFFNFGSQLMSTGSDGLLKIWTIKSNVCAATLDESNDKLWALAYRESSENSEFLIATGSADSVICLYKDVTKEDQEEKIKLEEERLIDEQTLSNFILHKDYKNAIILAMKLNQPYRILKLVQELLDGDKCSRSILETIICSLSAQEFEKFIDYIKDWNTNSKYASVSHTLLNIILKNYPLKDLIHTKKFREILDALISYSEKHFTRSEEWMVESWLIDLCLGAMDVI